MMLVVMVQNPWAQDLGQWDMTMMPKYGMDAEEVEQHRRSKIEPSIVV